MLSPKVTAASHEMSDDLVVLPLASQNTPKDA